MTKELNGNNGYDDVYIVYRDNRDSIPHNFPVVADKSRYDIFEADTMKTLVPWSNFGITVTRFFEISKEKIILVLSPNGGRNLRILIYDRVKEDITMEMNGEIPCFDLSCDWFNKDHHKLVFIDTSMETIDQKGQPVYQFDWYSHDLLEIARSSPHWVDAHGRRISLVGLYFDSDKNRFMYGQ